jgi:orotate phosphoribosyltransferase/adenine/guanine phosphoribosyltransferase-like PRPP-binding protein
MTSFRIEPVPELTSDESAFSFAQEFHNRALRHLRPVIHILDFSNSEPSPTKYNILTEIIVELLRSKRTVILANVSRAVVATSALGSALVKSKLSLPLLDRDKEEQLHWIGREPRARQREALVRILPSVRQELEKHRARSHKRVETIEGGLASPQLQDAISASGALISGHFVLPGGRHSNIALDVSRLLDQPELLTAIEEAIVTTYSKQDVRGILFSSHAATVSSLVARVSSRLKIQNEFRIFEEFGKSPGPEADWVRERSPILIITDVVRSGSWCRSATKYVRDRGSSSAGLVILVQNTGANLADETGHGPQPLVFHKMDLPFSEPDECELCTLGWPYREIRRREQAITSEYVSLSGTKRPFRRGLPFLPLEFYELVRASRCFRAGHLLIVQNPSVHYQSYFDTAEVFGHFGQMIGTRVHDFLKERVSPDIQLIVTTDGAGARLLGAAVANQYGDGFKPSHVAIPSSALRAALPALSEEAREKLKRRILKEIGRYSHEDLRYIIIDDGINYGTTMVQLYELLSSSTGKKPEACIAFLSRCNLWPNVLRSLVGHKLFYCYDWPIPPHALISGECPLDSEYRDYFQLRAILGKDDELSPYFSQRLAELQPSTVVATSYSRKLAGSRHAVDAQLLGWHDTSFSGSVWDELTLGGAIRVDELHMLTRLMRASRYSSVHLPIALEIISKNGVEVLVASAKEFHPMSLGAVGKALQLSKNRILELDADRRRQLAEAIFELLESTKDSQARGELLAAIIQCRHVSCLELVGSACAKDKTLIPKGALLVAAVLLSKQIVDHTQVERVIGRLREQYSHEANQVAKERVEQLSAIIRRLQEKTEARAKQKGLSSTEGALSSDERDARRDRVGLGLPAKAQCELRLKRLPGATFSQLLANLEHSTGVLTAAREFFAAVSKTSDIGIVFCGSFGRLEAGKGSDGDFLLIDFSAREFEDSKSINWPILRDFANWLHSRGILVSHYDDIVDGKYKHELRPDKGFFPNLSTADSLLEKVGTQEDTPETKTRRMALLLESAAVKEMEKVRELKASLLKEYGLRDDPSQTQLPWHFLRDIRWWLEDMEYRAAANSTDLQWIKWNFQRSLLCRSTLLAIGGLLGKGQGRPPTLSLYLDILSKPPILRLLQLSEMFPQNREARETISKLVGWADLAIQRYSGTEVNSYLKTGKVGEIDPRLAESIRHDLMETGTMFKQSLKHLHKVVSKSLPQIHKESYDGFK